MSYNKYSYRETFYNDGPEEDDVYEEHDPAEIDYLNADDSPMNGQGSQFNGNQYSKYNSFTFFGTMRDSLEKLPEPERSAVAWMIIEYGTTGKITKGSVVGEALLVAFIPVIENSHRRHEEWVKKKQSWILKQEKKRNMDSENKENEPQRVARSRPAPGYDRIR